MASSCEELLRPLVDKKYIIFTSRGNKAIDVAVKTASDEDKTRLLIQDQGGWLNYARAGNKAKMKVVELHTDYGLLTKDVLKNAMTPDSCLLINSLPGYCCLQEMTVIKEACSNGMLINDASGSIGTKEAKVGDIIVGSFGKGKPIDLGQGGFIATDNKKWAETCSHDDTICSTALGEKLADLPNRLDKLHHIHDTIKQDLKKFSVVHPNANGLNVIVIFKDEKEKVEIIKYCLKNSYEYTMCPRYIRILEQAISIEVKRL